MSIASDQTLFWICASVMVIFLMSCVWIGFKCLWEGRKNFESSELNSEVYADELAELKRDLLRGAISQEKYDNSKEELLRRALEDEQQVAETQISGKKGNFLLIPLLCLIPVVSFALYILVGNPSLISFSSEKNLSSYDEKGQVSLKESSKHLTKEELVTFLKESPKDARAWLALARLHNEDRNPQLALDAFNKAFELLPEKIGKNSGLVMERALTMLETGNPELVDKAKSDLELAIRLDTENVQAYEFLGMLMFREEDYGQAVKYWVEALNFYPEDSPRRIQLLDAISEAKNREAMNFRIR